VEGSVSVAVLTVSLWRLALVLLQKWRVRFEAPIVDTKLVALLFLVGFGLTHSTAIAFWLQNQAAMIAQVLKMNFLILAWSLIIRFFASIVAKFHAPTLVVVRRINIAMVTLAAMEALCLAGMLFLKRSQQLVCSAVSDILFAIYVVSAAVASG
jgi:hypothetical protein